MQLELLIALVSGVLTLAASFFVAMYKSRSEVNKMGKLLEEKYSTALFEKRLAAYPVLYQMLNTMNMAIEREANRVALLRTFQSDYEAWVGSHAILVTPSTGTVIWRYQRFLVNLLLKGKKTQIDQPQWEEIRNINRLIGKFLRAELGVYDTKPAGLPEMDKPHVQNLLRKLGASAKDGIRNDA